MPNMANITVVDAAGANVVWTAATPSAGDRSPAVWRSNSRSDKVAYRPSFSFSMKDNGKKTGRIMNVEFRFPIPGEHSDTGSPFLFATLPITLSGTLPSNIPVSICKDAFTQFGNLLVSSLIRSAVEEAYAPT